jgi:Spy/CpxP family protein refolding chaperone
MMSQNASGLSFFGVKLNEVRMNKVVNESLMTIASFTLSMLLLLCFYAAPAHAQESGPNADRAEVEQNARNQGGDLIRTLALTPEQVAKIRMIREQNREERQLAGERLRKAQRELDEVIYSDTASEALIEERSRELAAAQTAIARLRALTELRIRRVLTPEQINTMRTLRVRQTQRRLQREMNLERRMREGQPRNMGGGADNRRERFRAREDAPSQTNDNTNRPAATRRERRREMLRRIRP